MGSLLSRASWRHLRRHPWIMALSVLGVALGVSVVVAVDLANESASRAFALSVESLTGRTTHQIIGGPTGIEEALFARLRSDLKLRESSPVVEGYVKASGETLRLLGTDPFADGAFRKHLPPTQTSEALRLLTESDTVLMAGSTARRFGITPDTVMAIQVDGVDRPVRVVGLIQSTGQQAAAIDGLLLADISTAQEILGKLGRLDRIDLILPNDPAALAQLRDWLPDTVELVSAQARNAATYQLTRAFNINLTAMSLLAILVGMFLIYNTMSFSVLQRRRIIGILRGIGATRRGVFQQVLLEAIAIGTTGTILGLGLGTLLAQILIDIVSRTINDFYFVLTVSESLISPLSLGKGLVLGVSTSVLAAIVPGIEAAWAPPQVAQRRSAIEGRSHRLAAWLVVGGIALMLASLGMLAVPGKSLIVGFVALFLLIIGFGMFSPILVIGLARAAGGVMGRVAGSLGRMSALGVSASLSRTGIAVAALTVAISATVGVGVMISSFRTTVDHWLVQTLKNDIYVTAPSVITSLPDGTLAPEVLSRLASIGAIADTTLRRQTMVESPFGPIRVMATGATTGSRPEDLRFKKGQPETIWPAFAQGKIVLISEPLAYHRDLSPGDPVTLLTRHGMRDFTIGAVFYDYATDRGMIIMDRNLYLDNWDDTGVSSAGLDVADGQSVQSVIENMRKALADAPAAIIRSNAELRQRSLEVFDRTFAITNVLRLLAIAVAFVGVLSALTALQLERAHEFGVLRAIGVTTRQLWGMVATQTGLMGITAGLLAIPLGLVMAKVLIVVINTRSFGWSMQTRIPPLALGEAILLAVVAALLAGLYPAWQMARSSPAAALREE